MEAIKTKFQFKDLVVPFLGCMVYRVVSIQVNMDKSICYGCSDPKGEWKWFKDYEIKLAKPENKVVGFVPQECSKEE